MPLGTWLQVITKMAFKEAFVHEPDEKAYETAEGLPSILCTDRSSTFDTPILTVHSGTPFPFIFFRPALCLLKTTAMRRLIFLLLLVLLGINGIFFWKTRSSEPAIKQVCQVVCSTKAAKANGSFVLPGALVVFM
jgi:hypothetical protein